MWLRLLGTSSRFARIVIFPIAFVIGSIGYMVERKFGRIKEISYLNSPLNEGRMERMREIENSPKENLNIETIKKHDTLQLNKSN